MKTVTPNAPAPNGHSRLPPSSERWLPIGGFEGFYEVSSWGRVKSLARLVFNGGGWRQTEDRILNLRPDKDGYLLVTLTVDSQAKTLKVARLVAESFIPNPEEKLCVNHKNGNKLDNYLENLEWVTRSENQLHSARVLRNNIGEDAPFAKLKNSDLPKIRLLVSIGKSDRDVGSEFGVHRVTISRIRRNLIWQSI